VGRTVYALLVGINAYPPGVPTLHGCVNDVEAMERLLRARVEPSEDRLEVRTLYDEQASRNVFIATFREHLGRAEPGDTALFYYSGHGSQEPAPPEHAAAEPDGLNETLVLHDSRQPGVFDLADKELAALVAEVSDRGAHVTVILDCCHSGSGVRALLEEGTAMRKAPADSRRRPIETYLSPPALASPSRRDGADWLNVPGGRYVLLAACRSDQTAKEMSIDGHVRGAMSTALERTLAGAAGTMSYQDVQTWVAAAVRNLVSDQTPVLESAQPDDVRQPFLGGAAAAAVPVLTVSFEQERGWVLDAGLVQGIPAPASDGPATIVTLHRFPVSGADGAAADEPLASATVGSVGAATSVLDVDDGPLDRATTYRAVIRSLAVTPVPVLIEGEPEVTAAIRSALASSPVVRATDASPATLRILATSERISLTRPDAAVSLVADELPASPAAVRRIAMAVEQVAHWWLIAERSNPDTRIPSDSVELSCLDAADTELAPVSGTIERWYSRRGGTLDQPTMKIRLRNRSGRRLYFALLGLSELYGVVSLLPGGGVWLDPGEEAFAPGDDGRPILYLNVPQGQERTTDVLKLLVSTEEFDAQQLQQDDLEPPTRSRGPLAAGERGISTRPELPTDATDWTTRELLVTTVRPGDFQRITAAGDARLLPGVTVHPHPSLTASARLVTRPTAARDATVSLVPPLLLDATELSEPYAFGGTRSVGDELSILELADMQRPESVSTAQPLVVSVDGALAAGDHVLPIAYDGEDHLPLGYAQAAGDRTEIRLVRLPPPSEQLTRSLGGSVKILFRKIVLRPLGGYDYPRLSLVTFGSDGEPRYDHDADRVAAAVATARRVLLVVHGIIGDTRSMSAAARRTGLLDRYDTLLAFDYENINTPVPETARALGERLGRAGFTATDRRALDVLAHSMGGLVSRWYIEREGGGAVVDRLAVCGTPNAGSPWPRVEDLATAAVALALNGLSTLAGPLAIAVKAFGFLVRATERLDVALDDMRPGSDLLAALAGSPEPSVAYIAVAGDQPFGPAADPGHARRILEKLRVPQLALALLFGGEQNDLAVSVVSATNFGSSWTAPPAHLGAECSHVTYFASQEGMARVMQALTDGSA
jgi:hypothetical protein